jgi:hypothetical protein
MDFWIGFWGVFIIVGLSIFAAISAYVGIGGFFDLRALFRDMASDREKDDGET